MAGDASVSRLDVRPILVDCDEAGCPIAFRGLGAAHPLPIRTVVDHRREWLGALDGEPECDVWVVETPAGVVELRRLRHPDGGEDGTEGPRDADQWGLHRWED